MAEKATAVLTVRLSPRELAAIDEAAKRSKCSRGHFVKHYMREVVEGLDRHRAESE